MATQNRMKELYKKLSKIGFSKKFVQERVLPKQWQDEMSDREDDYQKLLVFLSSTLSLNLDSLKNTSVTLSFDKSLTRGFRGPEIVGNIDAGLKIAEGVARIALSGMETELEISIPSALAVRRFILEAGHPWVSFRNLLAYSWQNNIPVIHVQHLPPKSIKHRGIAMEINQRPAIILCQQYSYPARHLAVLAHEMGHFSSNHMKNMDWMSTIELEVYLNDRIEAEAHRYAKDLLTGGQDIPPDLQTYRSLTQLIEATHERSRKLHVDPGYLIVSRASFNQNWKEASTALSVIEGNTSAKDLINAAVYKYVSAYGMTQGRKDFFFNITGVSLESRAPKLTQASTIPIYTSPTLKLFAAWAKEDATDNLEEKARRQKEGDNLLASLSESPLSLRHVDVTHEDAA